jgi:hypothetical protein
MNRRIVMAVAAVLLAGVFVSARQRPAEPATGTAVISGRVVDGVTGRPVEGFHVSVSREPYVPGLPGGTTGADGAFSIRGLPSGTYRIWGAGPGYLEGRYGARRPQGDVLPVRVSDGGRRSGLEIRVGRSASIAGRVLDEQGHPVAGVAVRALQRKASAGGFRYEGGHSVATDDRGEYRISRLPPGDYVTVVPFSAQSRVLSAAAPKIDSTVAGQRRDGFPGQWTDYLVDRAGRTIRFPYGPFPTAPPEDTRPRVHVTSLPNAVTLRSAAPIHLDAGDARDGVDIQLQWRHAANVSGTITGPDGPFPGAVLRLTPDDFDGPSHLASFTANAHADGAFTFLLVPAGRYTLTATRASPPPREVQIIASGDAAVALEDVIHEDGENWWASTPIAVGDADVDDLVVTLQRGLRVTGRVQLEGAAGADTAPPPPIIASFSSPEARIRVASVRADPDGRFTGRLSPGRYVIGGGAVSWTFKTAIVDGREVGAGPVDVGTEDLVDVIVVLTNRPAALAGSVTSQGAVSDATVVLFPAERDAWNAPPSSGLAADAPWRFHRTRAEDGRFTLERIVPGDYLVAAIDEAAMADWPAPVFLDWIAPRATRITLTEGERRTLALEAKRR